MEQNFKKSGILLLILTLLSICVFAQIDTVRFNKYYFKKYWTDAKAIVTSPARWQRHDWIKLGLLVSGTASLTIVDQPVNDFVQGNTNKNLDYVSKNLLEPFGGNYSFLVMSGFLAHGILAKNKRSVSTALMTIESYALTSLIVRIPKAFVGRVRPDGMPIDGPFTIKGPFNGASFPSGHTSSVFSVASVIATQYRDSKWIPFTAYSVASLVGLSRIYDNKHWLSDVVAGAAIGTLVGNLVSHRTSNSRLTLVPFGNGNYQGVNLVYTW